MTPDLSSRRAFLRALGAAAAANVAGAGLMAPAPAAAAATMAGTQAPGWYRFPLGAFEVTAISDGTVDLAPATLLKAPAAKTMQRLAQAFLASPVETSVNAFLVNTGARLVLIDAGAGTLSAPTLGKLAGNLRDSGYRPEQVDDVFLTHLHPDHAGGLLADGGRAFPQATVHADRREADYWLNETTLTRVSADRKALVRKAMAALQPYAAGGRFQTFTADAELVPGVRSRASYGLTPGHTSYVVESKGQRMTAIGDLVQVGVVQFADPSVGAAFETDAKAAAAARTEAFKHAAKEGDLVAAAHLPFPGVGHLRSVFRGYEWLPLNYTRLH